MNMDTTIAAGCMVALRIITMEGTHVTMRGLVHAPILFTSAITTVTGPPLPEPRSRLIVAPATRARQKRKPKPTRKRVRR